MRTLKGDGTDIDLSVSTLNVMREQKGQEEEDEWVYRPCYLDDPLYTSGGSIEKQTITLQEWLQKQSEDSAQSEAPEAPAPSPRR